MRGVNKVILVGTLGQDPEVRYMPDGGAVTKISIATTEYWNDKNTGQRQEQTEWHRVSFFGKLAEIAGEYLKKGSKVYVEGSIHTRKWQDKQTGQDRYSTEIKANTLQFLGGKPSESESQGNQCGFGQNQQASRSYTNNAYAEASRGSSSGQARHIDNEFSDDIPFN